jgi:hypothetical protein
VGLTVKLSFDTVENISNSENLAFGGMIAILLSNSEGSFKIIFGTVSKRDDKDFKEKRGKLHVKIPGNFLTPDILRLMSNAESVGTEKKSNISNHILVETSQIMYDSYRPILEALKEVYLILMKMNPETIPFGKYICPRDVPVLNEKGLVEIDHPLYSRVPGFKLDLSCICTANNAYLGYEPGSIDSAEKCVREIQNMSSFDESQARALIQSIGTEFSCIQGPPVRVVNFRERVNRTSEYN